MSAVDGYQSPGKVAKWVEHGLHDPPSEIAYSVESAITPVEYTEWLRKTYALPA